MSEIIQLSKEVEIAFDLMTFCLYSNEPKSFILAFDLALGQGGQCDFETLSAIC